MSLDAIGARVAQIDQLISSVAAGPAAATTGTSATSFASALQSAQGTTSSAATGTTTATGSLGSSDTQYDTDIQASAAKYGVDPALLKGLIKQESGFNANARSSVGAEGLTQLMPSTAASLGVDPNDPAQAIDGGAKYLKEQLDRFGGNASDALAAYNAGPGAVAQYGGIPPYAETQNYVKSVLANAQSYGYGSATSTASTTPTATSAVPVTTTPVAASAVSGSTLGYSTI